MSNTTIGLAWFLSIISVGCSTVPTFRPELVSRKPPDYWLSAPIIAVVRVLNTSLLRQVAKPAARPLSPIRLMRVDGYVETVLKGSLGLGQIAYYVYVAGEGGRPNAGAKLVTGSRWIVFLREDQGFLRSYTDIDTLNLRVASGSHSPLDIPGDRPPGYKIAVVLLTPGSLLDVQPFLEYLPVAVADVRFIAKATDIADILKGLFRISPTAHNRACLVLAEQFWEQDACLLDLRDSPDGQVRDASRALLKKSARNIHSVVRRLRESPFNLDGSSTDPTEELEMLLGNSNPEVRSLAAAALKSRGG